MSQIGFSLANGCLVFLPLTCEGFASHISLKVNFFFKFILYKIDYFKIINLGGECVPDRDGELDKFAILDANHRFRFLPTPFWNESSKENFCPERWGDCGNNVKVFFYSHKLRIL